MSIKVFSNDRTVYGVAYDMAIALAAKDPDIVTAQQMIDRIASLLPACYEAARHKHKEEHPMQDIGMFR